MIVSAFTKMLVNIKRMCHCSQSVLCCQIQCCSCIKHTGWRIDRHVASPLSGNASVSSDNQVPSMSLILASHLPSFYSSTHTPHDLHVQSQSYADILACALLMLRTCLCCRIGKLQLCSCRMAKFTRTEKKMSRKSVMPLMACTMETAWLTSTILRQVSLTKRECREQQYQVKPASSPLHELHGNGTGVCCAVLCVHE